MPFNISKEMAWKIQYTKIWNETESQLFERWTTEPIKREGRYVHDKLERGKNA